jgi:hypothetical protein
MVKEPPVAFLPSLSSLVLQLLTKVFTNERMRIEIASMDLREREVSLCSIWKE